MMNFTITGAALTTHARNLVLEDEPSKAFRLLSSSLIGEGADKVIREVLAGERELIGDSSSGIGVEDTSHEAKRKYLNAMNWVYVGRVQLPGRHGWFRPQGIVTALDMNDAKHAASDGFGYPVLGDRSRFREWSRRRAEFYACAGGAARHVRCEIDGRLNEYSLVFEPCAEPPFWITPAKSEEAAVAAWLAAGRCLDDLGAGESTIMAETERLIMVAELEDDDVEQIRELAAQAEDERVEMELRTIGDKVREQAEGDLIPLTLLDGRTVQVPRAPFMVWALDREPELRGSLPDWKPVAQSGFKMCNDNPFHTDWILGAGLSIGDAYSDNVNRPAWSLAGDMQEAELDRPRPTLPGTHRAAVLSSGGRISGVVGEDILVLPNMDTGHLGEVMLAEGVIAEQGGELAHLAIVCREKGRTVMIMPGACSVFQPGMIVTLLPARGEIRIDSSTSTTLDLS